MARLPRSNGTLLLDIYQSLGELRGDVKHLTDGVDEIKKHGSDMHIRVAALDLQAATNLRVRKMGAGVAHGLSGVAGGGIGAFIAWLMHK